MNEIFLPTFGVVSAIAAGIMILTVFFMVTNRISRHLAPSGIIRLKGLLEERAPVDLVLENGERIPAVTLVGFTESNPANGQHVPYQLNHLAVFRKADGIRVFVRPESIKYMEETKPAGCPA